jgi:gas vesicle protein
MNDLVNKIQRELPDTDKDRYDTAYERGRAQARSGLLLGGLVFGTVVGAAATFLFDPNRGDGRRAQLASRMNGVKNDLTRVASGKVADLQNRAKGAAIETGVREPGDFTADARHEDSPSLDDDLPGAAVPDPLTADELEAYGAGGPIAGAATTAANNEAERASSDR